MSTWLDDVTTSLADEPSAGPAPTPSSARALSTPLQLGPDPTDDIDRGASWMDRYFRGEDDEPSAGPASELKTAGPHPVEIGTSPAPQPNYALITNTDRSATWQPLPVPTFEDPPAVALAFADGGEISLADSGPPEIGRVLAITGGSGQHFRGDWIIPPSSGDGTSVELTFQPAKPLADEAATGTSTEAARADHVHPLPDSLATAVQSTRRITTVAPLQGGGPLTEDLQLTLMLGRTAGTALAGDDPIVLGDRTASGIRTSTGVVDVASAATPLPDQVLTIVGDAGAGLIGEWRTPAQPATLTASNGVQRVDDDLQLLLADDSLVVSAEGLALGTIPPEKMTGLPAVPAGDTDATSKQYVLDQVATASAASLTAESGVQRVGNTFSARLADTSLAADTGAGLSVRIADSTLAVGPSGLAISAAYKATIDGSASKAYVDAADTGLSSSIAGKPNLAASGGDAGSASTAARSDHTHAAYAAKPSLVASGGDNGSAATAARSDHLHSAYAAKPDLAASGGNNGTAATAARSDHAHAAYAAKPDLAASGGDAGSAATAARSDHTHAAYAAKPDLVAAGSAGTAPGSAAGTAATAARSDHTHAVATVSAAGLMSSSDKSKLDGVATSATNTPLSSATPAVLGTAAAGSGTSAARSDHVHAHGSQPGGTTHADATGSTAGFMPASAVTKLAGVADNATNTPLTSAAPAALGTAAAGSGTSAARSDHVHAHGDQAGGSLHAVATTGAAGFMVAADKVKLDGVASGATNTPLGASTPAALGTAAAGVSNNAARADHVHAHGALTDPAAHALATTSAAGFLSGTDKTKLDAVATGATNTPLGSATPATIGTAAAGSGTSAAREDHVHAHGNQAGGTLHSAATTSTAGFMSSTDKSKLDGVATSATNTPLSSATPAVLGTAAAGSGTSAARSDHVHAHGDQAGGSLHALATTGADGFMSATDKTKLDGVAAGANVSTLASTTPAAVGTAAVGVGTTVARADHVHAHGNQAGGLLHAAATTSVAGFMSAADKSKFDVAGFKVYYVYAIATAHVDLTSTAAPTVAGQTQPVSTTRPYLLAGQSWYGERGLWKCVTDAAGVPTWTREGALANNDYLPMSDAYYYVPVAGDRYAAGALVVANPVWGGPGVGDSVYFVWSLSNTMVYTWPLLSLASASVGGLLSSADKTKLNALASGQSSTLGRVTVDALLQTPTSQNASGTISLNISTKNDFAITLTGNATLQLTNAAAGQQGSIWVRQDATGNRTLNITASGTTRVTEKAAASIAPQPEANALTHYSYSIVTVNGTLFLVLYRTFLEAI